MMKITIQEGMKNSRIYEEDGHPAGTVEGWPKTGRNRAVLDAAGSTRYEISKRPGGLEVKLPDGHLLEVDFCYEDEKTDHKKFAFRPPMAEKAVIRPGEAAVRPEKPDAEEALESMVIRQDSKRRITLWENGKQAGEVLHITSPAGHEVVCEEKLPAAEMALIYVIAYYLYHDDDVEIV